MLRTSVVGIDPGGVTLQREGESEYLSARTVIWAAGVRASTLAGELAGAAGAEPDRAGRVTVESDLTLQGHPEVVALGDMVRVRGADGEVQQLPGVAPVAIQQGRYAGRLIANRVRGRETPPFHYRNKGNLATIGRARAVADLNLVRVNGPLAWLLWLGVHIFYLIGFQNRLLVITQWAFGFLTRGRGAQLITGDEAYRQLRRRRLLTQRFACQGAGLRVADPVPAREHFGLALIAQPRDGPRREREPSAGRGVHLQPPRRQHAQDCPWANASTSPPALFNRASARSARAPIARGPSPPGQPSSHRFQPGLLARISGVVRPS